MAHTTLVAEARAFALKAHEGIFRKNKARDPYWLHLEEVAGLVEQAGGTVEEIAAAWLHDTVEDTSTTLEVIRRQFGDTVAHIVDGLTDLPDIADVAIFAILERKQIQAERVRRKSSSVKIVKIGDQTSNLRIVATDPPTEWNGQKCLDYILGANLVVEACKGVSPFLELQFREAYKTAFATYT